MEEKVFDYYLVPWGLVVMVAYHVWLLHRIIKHPTKTFMGINDMSNNGMLSVQTLRNNIMALTLLASIAIMLGSFIAILMASGSKDILSFFVFGDRSEFSFSVKFFCILSCIMVAFLLKLQL
ncbi:hypothetical protein UlMin_024644 [Ulmus minor]